MKKRLVKCKICGNKFEIVNSLRPYCSYDCGAKYAVKLQDKKKDKEQKDKINSMRENLKTKSDYIEILQRLVNSYIRKRDEGLPCISCGAEWGKYTPSAGHFYPTTYTFLRFNEDNIHGQCWYNCNKNRHGNQTEYRPKLEAKIGFDRLQWLHAHRHDKANFSIEWLKEQIIKYKQKLKDL
jgi:hypothetical protein